jgi:hypothetical protein
MVTAIRGEGADDLYGDGLFIGMAKKTELLEKRVGSWVDIAPYSFVHFSKYAAGGSVLTAELWYCNEPRKVPDSVFVGSVLHNGNRVS